MAEIKSTLDLVMARTKNMTLNAEEKKDQREKELKNNLAGLIQKYQDQAIKQTELTRQLDELKTEYGHGTSGRIVDELLRRIEVNIDNNACLSVLSDYFGLDTSMLETILAEFETARNQGRRRRIDALKTDLSNDGISGSAVIFNIEIDPQWQSEQNTLIDQFRIQLTAGKKRVAHAQDS
ncbi:MAG: hypothetical protein DSY90_13305 [Deltaproteobacteria bacterium]|nr:MAG: hypothetical protein DSY90_13305 [Deltaproteobacteria bacterium]